MAVVVEDIYVVAREDLGQGLTENTTTKKVDVKVDGTTVQIDANGALKAIQQLDVKLSGLEQVDGTKTLKATLSDGTNVTIDLSPFFPAGVVPTAIGFDADGKLEITLSDGTKVTSTESVKHKHVYTLGGKEVGYTVK